MALKGIDLRVSWLVFKLKDFLETYYPDAYKKLQKIKGIEISIYSEINRKEKESEFIFCEKFKKEFYQGSCDFCGHKYIPIDARHCKYRRGSSLREEILAKYKKYGIHT